MEPAMYVNRVIFLAALGKRGDLRPVKPRNGPRGVVLPFRRRLSELQRQCDESIR
jgi:hypothetical protein